MCCSNRSSGVYPLKQGHMTQMPLSIKKWFYIPLSPLVQVLVHHWLLEEFYKEGGVLKNFTKFTRKHLRWSLFLIKLQVGGCNFIKETPAQVFSCEFCEIFKNTFFKENTRWLPLSSAYNTDRTHEHLLKVH